MSASAGSPLSSNRQRPQIQRSALDVGAAGERGADVGKAAGDLAFIEVEAPRSIIPLVSAATRLPRMRARCRRRVDLHVEHRQVMVFDKEDTRPTGRQCSIFGVAPAQRESSPTPMAGARKDVAQSHCGRPP